MEIDLYPQGVENQAHRTLQNAVRPTGDGDIIAVSEGARFEAALFAETHVEQAGMYGYLPRERDRALASLIYLIDHQGTEYNDLTEEEPGRILHERRTVEMTEHLEAGQAAAARGFLHVLGNQWINQNTSSRSWKPEDGLTFYGSDENTLRTARTAARILIAAYTHQQKANTLYSGDFVPALGMHSAQLPRIQNAFDAMVSWTETRIRQSGIGLFVNDPMNKHALWPHTQWNSRGNLYHASGEPLNNRGSYASLITQGLSYDVLKAAAAVEKARPRGTETRALHYDAEAEALAKRVETFFLTTPDTKQPYLFSALDQHPITGDWRQKQTIASDALETLDTGLWERPGGDTIVRHIISQCFSPSFLTTGGIRFHAEEHMGNFIYAQGAHAVDIERNLRGVVGLHRYGYTHTAHELFARVSCLLQTLGHVPIRAYFDRAGQRLAETIAFWPAGAQKLADKPESRALQLYRGEEHSRRHAAPTAALLRICYALLSNRESSANTQEKQAFEDTLPIDSLRSIAASGHTPTAYTANQMPCLYLEHLTDCAQPLQLFLPKQEDIAPDFSLLR